MYEINMYIDVTFFWDVTQYSLADRYIPTSVNILLPLGSTLKMEAAVHSQMLVHIYLIISNKMIIFMFTTKTLSNLTCMSLVSFHMYDRCWNVGLAAVMKDSGSLIRG